MTDRLRLTHGKFKARTDLVVISIVHEYELQNLQKGSFIFKSAPKYLICQPCHTKYLHLMCHISFAGLTLLDCLGIIGYSELQENTLQNPHQV